MTGDLKIKEVTQKVKDKRDQDYLRVYGLIPLNRSNPEKTYWPVTNISSSLKKKVNSLAPRNRPVRELLSVSLWKSGQKRRLCRPATTDMGHGTKQVQQHSVERNTGAIR
ncbi:hypothetical protein FEF09_28445 [Chitinophaga pinensis]|uniref:DUF5724 domain-containing protein n=1 Tax=Chitinophaga pinensis TaxID=79329 RepID=A0A5C6LNQ0_9BACT|nr:hypothetical protein FEF09_28445 [Chitinophaga pinensis]